MLAVHKSFSQGTFVDSGSNVTTMHARDARFSKWGASRGEGQSGVGGASSSNWRENRQVEDDAVLAGIRSSWRQLRPAACSWTTPARHFVVRCRNFGGNNSCARPAVSSSQDRDFDHCGRSMWRAPKSTFQAEHVVEPLVQTYASMLKKPLDPGAKSASVKNKVAEPLNTSKMAVFPCNGFIGLRLASDRDEPREAEEKGGDSSEAKASSRKSTQNKLDHLRDLLGLAAGPEVENAPGDNNSSNSSSKSSMPTVGAHLVNGKGRPEQRPPNNSLIALIMGFGLASPGSDDDEDSDDDDSDGDWDVVDCGSSETTAPCEAEANEEYASEGAVTQGNTDNTIRLTTILELADANLRWHRAYSGVACETPPHRKVLFANDSDLETVHSASPECRKSPWEQLARDRHRFQRRVQETESLLEPILRADHRHRIYDNRIAPGVLQD